MNRRRLIQAASLAGMSASVWATAWAVDFGLPKARTRPECLDGIPDRDYQYRPRSASVLATSRRAVLLAVAQVDVELRLQQLRESAAETETIGPRAGGGGAAVNPSRDARPFPPRRFREAELPPPTEDLPLTSPIVASPEVEGASYDAPLRTRTASRGRSNSPSTPRRPLEIERQEFAQQLAEAERATITRLYQLDRTSLAIDQCEISQVALQLRSDGLWVLSLRADQNKRPDELAPAPFNPKLHIKRNEFHVKLRCLGAFANSATEYSGAAGQPVIVDLDPEPFWVENGQPRYVRLVGCDRRLMARLERVDRVELEFFYR
ncbi:MAG: hypothetical protein U0939_20515 [Pirellulales bacterium]